ncbi:NUDIX domain-containing protein [Streptomyces sp. NPDC059970]|uniref:NUDIX hydrolase n=1 Tax=Streptomyces sp. NPDC059970 TaxID=3347019 RepID=UPI0036815154
MNASAFHQSASTAVLIVNSRGEYLLHLRDAHKPICDAGTWSLVGGGPEPGETPDEAIAREILEETGLVLSGITAYTTVQAHGPNVTEGNIQVYMARWDGVAHDLPVTEGIMFAWFDIATMEQLAMCSWAHEVIKTHHVEHPAPLLPGPRDDACQGGAGAVKNVIGAHLFLERDGRTLLGRRHPDVEFAGGAWHALAGHVEWESVRACLIREAYEEAGITVEPADLTLVHTVHLLDDRENAEPRIQLFFRASRWSGEPEIREPDRCTAWQWWPLDGLPDPMVGYTRAAIEGILAGTAYTELGWAPAAPATGGR